MSDQQQPMPEQMTEEQLQAAYEAEIKKVRVEQVLLENIVTIVNLGMRRTGLMPGTEDERDPDQIQVAIESVRSQMPLIEVIAPEQVEPIRQALSQLQMAYVQITGGAVPAADSEAPAVDPEAPGPAQSSGRLWVPGQ